MFGVNFEWLVNDNLMVIIDVLILIVEDNSGGDNFFMVIGYNNEYSVDYLGIIFILMVVGGDLVF